jgi:quercetin dioxygenase-like cupin family protein
VKCTFLAIGLSVLIAVGSVAVADPAKTIYTLPQDIRWLRITGDGVPKGAYYAYLRGNQGDACGSVVINRFPNGFVYPWHVNHEYDLITILKGTLVLGFDKQHKKWAERVLPAGSFIQGLATEPHYGRAVGETIFEYFSACPTPK